MLRAIIFSFVLSPILAAQLPLGSPYHWQAKHDPAAVAGGEGITEWSLDKLPNPNTTDHLVFDTVYSLMQNWPNTRTKSGHNIVPGSIPKGTLLYYGTDHNAPPPGPDWVATDPEHAYMYCCGISTGLKQECWQLTLTTTRPLKIVYFDGGSALKLPGSMDTQDLLMWGRVDDQGSALTDTQRIEDLCKWGKNMDVDGFVRMELDFEVMLCDFTSGVSVVSFENLVSHWPVQPWKSPVWFEAVYTGYWHSYFPGETRVQLDLSGLVSFYDTQLAPSLVPIRAGQERGQHRVQNISTKDLSAAKSRLESTLTGSERLSSGTDWKTLFQVIVDRYAQRLELTRYLLNSSATEPAEILDFVDKTQTQLRVMLMPYLVVSAIPADPLDKAELDWATPVYRLCATTHTYSMDPVLDSMTDSEKLLLQAVRGTSREICRVVTKMWVAGVYAGIDPLLNTKESLDIVEVTQLRNTWTEALDHLMGWLDWSMWIKCNPACGPEEVCYLNAHPSPSDSDGGIQYPRPQPKCSKRYEIPA